MKFGIIKSTHLRHKKLKVVIALISDVGPFKSTESLKNPPDDNGKTFQYKTAFKINSPKYVRNRIFITHVKLKVLIVKAVLESFALIIYLLCESFLNGQLGRQTWPYSNQ
uniref:Uncharacterized protein n=1 Tax=Glossina palpalis gambiensis TaxID=67801 RepID=A0A1B0C505_9MUSC